MSPRAPIAVLFLTAFPTIRICAAGCARALELPTELADDSVLIRVLTELRVGEQRAFPRSKHLQNGKPLARWSPAGSISDRGRDRPRRHGGGAPRYDETLGRVVALKVLRSQEIDPRRVRVLSTKPRPWPSFVMTTSSPCMPSSTRRMTHLIS